jgi:hypothetical protein
METKSLSQVYKVGHIWHLLKIGIEGVLRANRKLRGNAADDRNRADSIQLKKQHHEAR